MEKHSSSNVTRCAHLGVLPLSIALLTAGACKDPSKSKPQAEVHEPAPAEKAHEAEAPVGAVETLAVNAENTSVKWVGSKVTGSHDGGFKTVSGQVKLASAEPEKSVVEIEIDTTSLYSDNDQLSGHLKSGDFFDVEKFPTAKFVSTGFAKVQGDNATHTVTGDLTLHGVTKSISFPATLKVEDSLLTVASEFSINRKDFGINYPGMKDDLIRDGVVIKLDLKLPRAAS